MYATVSCLKTRKVDKFRDGNEAIIIKKIKKI
jgi:hypothetical protein